MGVSRWLASVPILFLWNWFIQRKLHSSTEKEMWWAVSMLVGEKSCVCVSGAFSGSYHHPYDTIRHGIQASGCLLWRRSGFPALKCEGITFQTHCHSPQDFLGPLITNLLSSVCLSCCHCPEKTHPQVQPNREERGRMKMDSSYLGPFSLTSAYSWSYL